MRYQTLSWMFRALCALALGAGAFFDVASAQGVGPQDAGAIGAKIIGVDGAAEARMSDGTVRPLAAGDEIRFGEDLTIHKGSRATLAMSDRTLREFTGPTTLTIRREAGPAGGTILGNLTAAVAAMLFSGKQRSSDVVMATRSAGASPEATISVPALIHPAPGENLAEAPKRFRWKAVEGVPLYRVSVYSASQMMWQSTTAELEASCPARICDFRPGETYHWVVEALVGNTTLRSGAAGFTIASADHLSALAKALTDADASVADPGFAVALKVRLCLDSGAYARALALLDQAIAGAPSRAAYALRAEVNGRMGLVEEALGDYRRAIAIPSSE